MRASMQEPVAIELTREVGVLSSLAHFGWLNTQQLHALCFPGLATATVRTTLHFFEEAGWIQHVRWRIGPIDGGHIWAVCAKGVRVLERYLPVIPRIVQDLARPSSALEHEEWRIELAIRNFVTRLVLEVRQQAHMATFTLTLPTSTQQFSLADLLIEPDAVLSVVWEPPTVQEPMWLPWATTTPVLEQSIQYVLYCDRMVTGTHLTWLVAAWAERTATASRIPVLLLDNEERYIIAHAALTKMSLRQQVRLATWSDVQHSICHGNWHDGCGRTSSLHSVEYS